MQWSKETSNSKWPKQIPRGNGSVAGYSRRIECRDGQSIHHTWAQAIGKQWLICHLQSVYNNFPLVYEGSTGFVDVRDVASAMISLMEHDIFGAVHYQRA